MRTHLRSISVALAIAGAPAVYAHSDHCNVDSDYDFKITDDALVFERDSGNPERVEFRHGELIIDGQRQNLSTADRDRVARFERDAREIVPEAKAIALDAVDLAAVALEQVATAFASGDDRDRIIARGNDLRVRLRDRIESANSSDSFDEEEFEEAIEEIVETAVPELVGGVAAMAQLDGSLDEASLTLGAGSGRTMRKVILPLMRPAILAALVYSFVRAITSISAVIFLVSAKYNMATAYIVGLVENGEYGIAIAYSSVLILVMITVIGGFQLLVGDRRIRRQDHGPKAPAAKERTA